MYLLVGWWRRLLVVKGKNKGDFMCQRYVFGRLGSQTMHQIAWMLQGCASTFTSKMDLEKWQDLLIFCSIASNI